MEYTCEFHSDVSATDDQGSCGDALELEEVIAEQREVAAVDGWWFRSGSRSDDEVVGGKDCRANADGVMVCEMRATLIVADFECFDGAAVDSVEMLDIRDDLLLELGPADCGTIYAVET